MEPGSLRLAPEELRLFLDGWSAAELRLRPIPPAEVELAAALILAQSAELRPTKPARSEGTRRMCQAACDAGDLFVFVEQAGVPCGLLRGELYAAGPGQRQLYVSSIGLRPELRAAGTGSRLLRHLESWARALGVGAITLDFMADNPRVASFYRRLGYEHVGYDLFQALDGAAAPLATAISDTAVSDRAAPVATVLREYERADGARVLTFLRGRQGLCTFERPVWSDEELATQLELLATDTQQRVLLAERAGMLTGLCWTLSKLGSAGAPLLIASCFEAEESEAAAQLLAAIERAARAQAAVASYVTLWEPCRHLLELCSRQGYGVGRYKLRKSWPGAGAARSETGAGAAPSEN